MYFLANTMETHSLMNVSKVAPQKSLLLAERITISSFFNICIILASYIEILINSTFNLNLNSLFITKVLPYSNKEVHLAIKLFKTAVGFLIYELFLLILVPSLNLIRLSPIGLLLFIIAVNLVYIDIFLTLDLLREILIKIAVKISQAINSVFSICLFLLISYYFFDLRFKLEMMIGNSSLSLFELVINYFCFVVITLLVVVVLSLRLRVDITTSRKMRFFKYTIPGFDFGLQPTMLSLVRNRLFIYLSGMLLLLITISFIQATKENTLQLCLFLLPAINIVGLSYYDTTFELRRLYPFYRISVFREIKSLIMVGITLNIPLLMIALFELQDIGDFIFGLDIFLASIVIGFAFPREQGVLNETISAILIIIIAIVLLSLVVFPWILWGVSLCLGVILWLILKNERRLRC